MDADLMRDGGAALGWLAAVLVGPYGAYVLVASLAAPRILYPFGQEPFRHPAFEMRAVASDGLELPVAVHAGRPGAPVVLIFVGNYGARGAFGPLVEPFLRAGFTVAVAPYRGAEGLPGPTREAQFKADALAVFDALPELAPPGEGAVHLLGYSLGSGLALHVAAHREVASVLLEAPFARLCEVMTRKAWAPACLIPWVPRWDSLALVPDVVAPVFIAQGVRDEVIPSRESLRLAAALIAHGNVVVTRYDPRAGHNTVPLIPGLSGEMVAWVEGGWTRAVGQSLEEARAGFVRAGGRP
jgi:hypothetical protein